MYKIPFPERCHENVSLWPSDRVFPWTIQPTLYGSAQNFLHGCRPWGQSKRRRRRFGLCFLLFIYFSSRGWVEGPHNQQNERAGGMPHIVLDHGPWQGRQCSCDPSNCSSSLSAEFDYNCKENEYKNKFRRGWTVRAGSRETYVQIRFNWRNYLTLDAMEWKKSLKMLPAWSFLLFSVNLIEWRCDEAFWLRKFNVYLRVNVLKVAVLYGRKVRTSTFCKWLLSNGAFKNFPPISAREEFCWLQNIENECKVCEFYKTTKLNEICDSNAKTSIENL